MSDLEEQARELGIKVDARWSEETLRSKIDAALEAPAAEAPDFPKPSDPTAKLRDGVSHTIPVRINRDYWDGEGERHRKGTVVDLTVEAAMDGVESGAVSRVK